jgi:hypothetical protein
MDHLARQMRATMSIAGSGSCYRIAEPTPTQARALELRQDGSGFVDSNQPPMLSKKARYDGLVCIFLAVAPV